MTLNPARAAIAPPDDVHVEPWPAGGWAVWLGSHHVPVSRHDTEEEALARAEAYRRGLAREGQVNDQAGVGESP